MKTKLSAFTGISLLILIIGFTVFVNLPKQEKKYRDFTREELEELWKLEGVETDITTYYPTTTIKISKVEKNKTYSEIIDSEESWNYTFVGNENKPIYNYGSIELLIDSKEAKSEKIIGFEVNNPLSYVDSIYLSQVGHLFIKHQIDYISSRLNNWSYTIIHLRDGRMVFLVRENQEMKGQRKVNNYYKELVKNAKSINDSTKIILPLKIEKIQEEFYEIDKRINLFEINWF